VLDKLQYEPDLDPVAKPRSTPADPDHEFCPVHASIDILQAKWAMHVIRALLEHGELGFNDLQRAVGANPATLSERLDCLERTGVVRRTVHSHMPPRTSYALTSAGVALQDVIDAIGAWGRRHLERPHDRKDDPGPRAGTRRGAG
jgi:DNA-binding HxlR family transcriptional regulator